MAPGLGHVDLAGDDREAELASDFVDGDAGGTVFARAFFVAFLERSIGEVALAAVVALVAPLKLRFVKATLKQCSAFVVAGAAPPCQRHSDEINCETCRMGNNSKAAKACPSTNWNI